MTKVGWRSWLVAGVLAGLAALAAWSAWGVWASLDGVVMSVHGWIALGLGVVLSLALGVGLMTLAFFSARHGYDDQVDR